MLSPHEFAALMLIENAPDQVERNRLDLAALLERRLVSFENMEGRLKPTLTAIGASVLAALKRFQPT